MKNCGECDKMKDASEFYKRSKSIDGLAAQCKPCANGYIDSCNVGIGLLKHDPQILRDAAAYIERHSIGCDVSISTREVYI